MEEQRLSEETKGAIRGYMWSLVALPSVIVSLIFFVLGIFVRDWGAKIGEVEAYKQANAQLAKFVDAVAEAKFKAQQASDEAQSLAANTKLAAAATTSADIRTAVAEVLKSDETFLASLRTSVTPEMAWEQGNRADC